MHFPCFRVGFTALLALLLSTAAASAQEGRVVSPEEPLLPLPIAETQSENKTAKVELHRLRIINRKDGAIQVSTDQGKSWELIGRVLYPATTVVQGYLAANYAAPASVAATAIHGLRIRSGGVDPALPAPLTLAIEPAEFARRAVTGGFNKGYGGHRAGAGGIFTDIPAGTSLFRDLAPLVGNTVYLETASGRLIPLPDGFRPSGWNETLVIIVDAPANSLTSVTFPNKAGGTVEATFADGTTQAITQVIKPVLGVGRFDGTAYTGVGRLNTAHTGVITVSTAPINGVLPEGEGKERRGGFQISPAWHNARTEEAGTPVVMTLGTPGPRQRELEGTAPLFRDAIGLDSVKDAGIVDASIDNGPWEPMPAIVGFRGTALTGPGLTQIWKEQKVRRTSKQGVTAFRLRLPKRTPEATRLAAASAVERYRMARLAAAKAGKVPIVKGLLTINANPTNNARVSVVRLFVEGTPRGFTNVAPFSLTWDTTRVPDGEYLIEAEALDDGGGVLASNRRRVFVLNTPDKVSSGSNDGSGSK